ncbi:hypothetical protein Hanom_Chr09g00788561 [Helianthus anomalus]
MMCRFVIFINSQEELSYVKGAWEEIYKMHNEGIQMLGQIKHGFCHPLAILFKVPADMVGIDCMLMVESRELERTDSHRHVIVSRIRNINLLYNLLPGEPNVAVSHLRRFSAPSRTLIFFVSFCITV